MSTKGLERKQTEVDVSNQNHALLVLGLSVLAFAMFLVAFLFRDNLSQSLTYSIASSSQVRYANDGQTLVIDNGKSTLLLLDAEGHVAQRWDGGSEEAPFFYACHTLMTPDGSIYVADITYGNRGNLLDQERVVRFNGTEWETLFSVDYTKWEIDQTPMQYGRILELDEKDGTVWFTMDTLRGVARYELGTDGSFSCVSMIPADFVKIDATYDPDSDSFVLTARNGALSVYRADGSVTEVLGPEEKMIPFDAAISNGEVYYTELTSQKVFHFSLAAPEEVNEYAELESTPYKLDVSDDGKDVLISDYGGFFRLTGNDSHDGAEQEYVDAAPVSYGTKIILTWAALFLGILATAYPLFVLIRKIVHLATEKENAMRVILIVAASLTVAFVLSYALLNQILQSDTTASERQVSLISELLSDSIDTVSLAEIDEPSDYATEAFKKVKEPLDHYMQLAYERGDYYYYMIYRALDGVNVCSIMDFEDCYPCMYPAYADDPETSDYARVIHTGEEMLVSEISTYGAWTFLLSPIYDDSGEVIALLEVGQSLDAVQNRQNELKRELLINAAISTVVVTMLLLEVTFYFAFVERKRETPPEKLDKVDGVPLRTLMFIIYLADSMQDAFIAILCFNMYKNSLPLPSGVAVALPMSAQLLMMALFSLFVGRFVEKFGSRQCLTAGMLIQMAGFLTCMLVGSYNGLLIGKLLIGAGMGTVYVNCNSVAATGSTSTAIAEANAGVSAGTLAGLTIGAGLASVLLTLGGWRLIYLVGAVIVGIGALLAMTSVDVRPGHAKMDVSEEQQYISFRKFFFRRRVVGFFLLILVPFMMALSYREYFFPLYAQEFGITEIRIGQIYLLCGMLVLYIGPYLSSWMIKKLGAYWSIITASALMGLNMLMFVLFPSLTTVITGVVILSVIISFAYTCQYTYFELTPEMMQYGEGRAMGIYSVLESFGQTVGPVAYGALLALGYQKGIGIFSVVMIVFIAFFALLMRKLGKYYR